MDVMLDWFKGHLDIIFFVYGVAFVVMGIAILAQPRRESQFRLAGILWLLAAFGLSHGLNEWFDMWAIIRGTNAIFDMVRWIVVTLSFVFLFEFGRRIFNINAEARRGGATVLLRWWLTPLIVVVILAVSLFSGNFRQTGTWLGRYFLCFPGAVLAGIGFYQYIRIQPDTLPLRKVKNNFTWTSLAFIVYGVLAGLVVNKGDFFPAIWLNTDTFAALFHVPVQLFRAAMAVIAAVSIAGMLRLFTWESVEKIEEALAGEHESRLSFERVSNQYQLILDSVGDGILVLDKNGMVTLLNSAGARITGYGQLDLADKDPHTVFHHTKVDGTPFPRTQCPIYLVLQDGTPRLVTDDVFWKSDGSSFPVEYICTPIRRDKGESAIDGAVVVFSDVTWRREAEQKQKKLQAQVLQIQKMDAIGTLAAGIAHDFNNMLTVIQGHVDIARMKMDRDAPVQKNLNTIYDTSVRAASLTRQLLAFGRRQPMDMKLVDTNVTIENILKMLTRVIGETIQVETDLKKGLWVVKA
ncbi:MAG: PAS domain S-box protein, partial [Nitrospirota bacterium]|nr:PAS domain S-box protein [Nitrospirota bacterium]